MRRRLVPDPTQVQIVLGSLLGSARLDGTAGALALVVADAVARESYVRWKYERLGWLADAAPLIRGGTIAFRTIAHPLLDDLAPLVSLDARRRARAARPLLAPLGIAVWLADLGRLELRAGLFVARRGLAA